MSIKIEIEAKDILAVSCLSAQKDIRYYLNGVLLEIWPTRSRLVATDGHCLGIIQRNGNTDLNGVHPDDGTPYQAILPNGLIDKIKNKKGFIGLAIEPNNGLANAQDTLTLTLQDFSTIRMQAEAGKFPDYMRVIPPYFSGEVAQFDLGIVNKFYKAYNMLANKKAGWLCPAITIAHNGPSGALVGFSGYDEFIGIIMPLRNTEVVKRPAWL